MKRTIIFLSIALILGFLLPQAAFAQALVLYDDFSGNPDMKTKWSWDESVREIRDFGGGDYRLLLQSGTPNPKVIPLFPHREYLDFPFTNPNTTHAIQADVTILDSVLTGNAELRASIAGRWYNDGSGTPGSDMTGDIWAELSLWQDQAGVSAKFLTARFANSTGSALILNTFVFSLPINLQNTYTLYLSYESGNHRFVPKVGNEEYILGSTGIPARVRDANVSWKALSVRCQVNDAASSASVAATFDNIERNGFFYDDFSSQVIDSSNWDQYEQVRETVEEKARLKVRSSYESEAHIYSYIDFLYPQFIHTVQAKFTLTDYQNPQGLYQRAAIQGGFFNDGSGNDGLLGDVAAQIRFGGTGFYPTAEWTVWRYADADGTILETIASGTFAEAIIIGKTYSLFLDWNGSRFTFKLDDEEATYSPTTPIHPIKTQWKHFSAITTPEPTMRVATLEVLIDDVMVNGFTDCLFEHWAYPYVMTIYNARITAGYGDGRYGPEDLVTREQMAVFILKALDEVPSDGYCGGVSPFTDVAPDRWSCKYIKRFAELGITSGYGDGSFGPEDLVTREQMAAFLIRAMDQIPAEGYCGTTDPFTDVPHDGWSCGFVKKLAELGVTAGYGDGRFGPEDEVSRAQMAVFLSRSFPGM